MTASERAQGAGEIMTYVEICETDVAIHALGRTQETIITEHSDCQEKWPIDMMSMGHTRYSLFLRDIS